MNVTELIEKHAKEAEIEDVSPFIVETVLKPFAIALLKLVKVKAKACQHGNLDVGLSHVRAIDNALDELKKEIIL